MICEKLITVIIPHLKEAEEVWVAVALLKENTLKVIQDNLPQSEITQHFLVGIDLPTSPEALLYLKQLSGSRFNAVIYKEPGTFHPKVYIIRKGTAFVAFIGSSNATKGGFYSNIEMNYCITDQGDCLELLHWFKQLFKSGKSITDELIEKYKKAFQKNLAWRSTQESNSSSIFENEVAHSLNVNEGQFFRQTDFEAYHPQHHTEQTVAAKGQRKQVRERLLALHELIFPHFHEFGMTDLHTPARRTNYTSQYFHSRGAQGEKDAIWLNYGKSKKQLKDSEDKTFINNIRIQIILRHRSTEKYIGLWLFIGKPNKSLEDRKLLVLQATNSVFLNLFFNLLQELGDSYWIMNQANQKYISEFDTPEMLGAYLTKDDFTGYYKIGRNYEPNSSEISEDNIKYTVLTEFSKLYKLYSLIKK